MQGMGVDACANKINSVNQYHSLLLAFFPILMGNNMYNFFFFLAKTANQICEPCNRYLTKLITLELSS